MQGADDSIRPLGANNMARRPTRTSWLYTPMNPDPHADKRIKHKTPVPASCPHCDGSVQVAKNSAIYGKLYGDYPWVYMCENFSSGCRTYVGIHPGSNVPLGTMADDDTRGARKWAKSLFITMYERYFVSRGAAYAWLAHAMGIPQSTCHFGMFNVQQCNTAAAECTKFLEEQDGTT